jgi:cytochrome P450
MSIPTTATGRDYLWEFDRAAEADKYSLVRNWMDTEPLPFFKQLREQRPILVTPEATLVTRFDDVTSLLNMPLVFTVALYLPKMANGIYLMAHDDDALHTREKSLMKGLLNRDDLPQVRAMVAKIAGELLSAAKGHMDSIDGYCRMVPASLLQQYFGLTGIDKKKLI